MSKPNLTRILQSTRTTLVKHSPEILTGLGIAGMITSAILAVRATPKALDLIFEKEYEVKRELTKKETVKIAWKLYIPAVVTGAASTACLIGANSVNCKRNAALAAAYTLTDTAFREYKEQVVESLGEKKERAVLDKVAEKQVKENPVNNEIIVPGKGPSLCLEPLSMRYFNTDFNSVVAAGNKLNTTMINHMGEGTINDFYDLLDLPHTEVGDYMGWTVDHQIEIHPSSTIAENGEPALVIVYDNPPKYLGY